LGVMRSLTRNPLTWMLLGELAVVAALILVAWHWIAAVQDQQSAAAPPALFLPVATPDPSAQASPVAPKTARSVARQQPGLNLDTGFWRQRLTELNRDEAAFEQLEWRIVHSAMDTIQRYTESVVIPSVERAERGGG
jgi:hypothetical protein